MSCSLPQLLLSIALSQGSGGALWPPGTSVSVPAGVFAPRAAEPRVATERTEAGEGFAPGYFLVHFSAPLTAADRRWLDESTGAVTRSDGTPLARWYLPDDTLCAWVASAGQQRALQAHESVAWVGRYTPAMKLDPALADAPRGRALTLEVELVPGHPAAALERELASLGTRLLERVDQRGRRGYDLSFLVLEAMPAQLPGLARLEGVRRLVQRAPDGLDAARAAELAAAAHGPLWLAGSAPLWSGYEAEAALLDQLAFDAPDELVVLATRGDDPRAWPKNVLAVEPGQSEAELLRRPWPHLGTGAAPSAALLRALALHATATGTGPERPPLLFDVSAREGFASADAPAHVRSFRALPGEPVALTLVWTDEPGRSGSSASLVNDLDLVVSAPDGALFRRRLEADAAGARGVVSEPFLAAEHFLGPRALPGTWTVKVEPVRGAFSVPQGYALVASGLAPAPEAPVLNLEIPGSVTLRPVAGWNSKNGAVASTDLALVASGDDQRLVLRDRESLTFSFQTLVPPGALLTALRVKVEHHELPRVVAGDIQWRLGRGSISAPSIVASSAAPLRSGPAAETLDTWLPASLVPDGNDLELVIQNGSQSDATLLDQVLVEVDYLVSDAAPVISSSPNPSATVGQSYLYDADGRAQATSASAVAWSLVRGPSGFAIQTATGLVSWTPTIAGAFAVTLRATNASGFSEQSFTLTAQTQPTLPATLLPASASALVYLPPERLALGPAKSQQRLNVFLPPGTPPVGGWPVVLNNRAGGGLAALPLGALQDTGATAPLHAFVASGIAVVDFGVTGIGGGLGLFYPPGHASGRYESFRSADDNPEKDAEWALQWLKTQTGFALSKTNICLRGSSQGAILALWCAMGPERARPSGSAQVRASTRVKAVLALQPPTSNWAFDQDPTFSSNMISHYEQAAAPGVPATVFRQVAESLQKADSVMGFGFASPEARAWNESQAVCLIYNEPVLRLGGAPADMTLDGAGYPRLRDALLQTFVHDSWAGYVFFRRLLDLSPAAGTFHRANSLFAVRDTTALPAPQNWHTHTYSGLLTGAGATALAHDWVRRTLGVAPR